MPKQKGKPKARKAQPICVHATPEHLDSIMYRCACGNVWMGGEFQGSVPKDRTAVSIFGAFSRQPAGR